MCRLSTNSKATLHGVTRLCLSLSTWHLEFTGPLPPEWADWSRELGAFKGQRISFPATLPGWERSGLTPGLISAALY